MATDFVTGPSTLGIVRDVPQGKEFSSWTGKRMYLYSESGKLSFAVDYAPRDIEYGGLTQNWVQVDRAGREPLLMRKGNSLKTMKFSFMMADADDMYRQQTEAMNALENILQTRERVMVRFGPQEAGLWRITECTVTSGMRHPETDEMTRGMASIGFTRASDPSVSVGPVTGGTQPAPAAPAPSPPRTHRVVKGDTLWGIAQRYYGKGTLWPKIFDANRGKIKDPHWIYVNQEFVIP